MSVELNICEMHFLLLFCFLWVAKNTTFWYQNVLFCCNWFVFTNIHTAIIDSHYYDIPLHIEWYERLLIWWRINFKRERKLINEKNPYVISTDRHLTVKFITRLCIDTHWRCQNTRCYEEQIKTHTYPAFHLSKIDHTLLLWTSSMYSRRKGNVKCKFINWRYN